MARSSTLLLISMSTDGTTTEDTRGSDGARSTKISEVRNVVMNWGSFLVAAVAGLALSPMLIRALGKESYGVWVLVGALVGPLSLLDLGVRTAVTRLVARHHALHEHERASAVASTARLLYAAAGLIAIVTASVFAVGLSRWFTVPAELASEASFAIVVVGAALAINLSTDLHSGILMAVRRLDQVGLAGVVLEVVRVAAVLAVIWMAAGLYGLAVMTVCLAVARYLWLRWASHRAYPQLVLTAQRPRRPDVKAILDISVFTTVIYAMGTVTNQVNTYMVGATLPLAMVTFHAIGATLPTAVQSMSLPIAQSVLPQASQLDATGRIDAMRTLILDAGRYGALATLPIILAFITRGSTFLGVWAGEEFRGDSGPVLLVLSVAGIFQLGRHVLQTVFIGSGRHRQLIVWYGAESVVTVLLSVVLVREFGITGAAWASAVPPIVITGVVLPALVSRSFGLSPISLWMSLWIRPLVALTPYALLSWYTDRQWPATGYLAFFGQVAVTLPVAALGALTLGLSATERTNLETQLRSGVRNMRDRMHRARR